MFRDLSDVRGSSLPEEFRSLSVRAFGATMDNGRIACGRFALSIIDHGAKAGSGELRKAVTEALAVHRELKGAW